VGTVSLGKQKNIINIAIRPVIVHPLLVKDNTLTACCVNLRELQTKTKQEINGIST